jgi:hypothetical protein
MSPLLGGLCALLVGRVFIGMPTITAPEVVTVMASTVVMGAALGSGCFAGTPGRTAARSHMPLVSGLLRRRVQIARIAPLPPPVSMKDWRAASCDRKCTRCCLVLGTKGLKRRVVGMVPVAQ